MNIIAYVLNKIFSVIKIFLAIVVSIIILFQLIYYLNNIITPRLKWRFKTNGWVYSTPAIIDNVAYFGSFRGRLYAVDVKTGKEVWRFKTHDDRGDAGDKIFSSPSIYNNTVFIASNIYLYAVDIKTRKEKWRYETAGMYSSPAISDGILCIGHLAGSLYTLDTETGKVKWIFNSVNKEKGIGEPMPSIANSTVYFGFYRDNYFYAVDFKTGALKWKFDTQSYVYSKPTIKNGVVYVGSADGFFYALDSRTGDLKWKFKASDKHIESTPAIAGGTVYFTVNEAQPFGYLYALDVNTGHQKWKIEGGDNILSSPVVDNGIVYFGSSFKLYAVDANTGKEKWRFRPPLSIFGVSVCSSPIIVDDVLYFGSTDKHVYAVDVRR